jgi:hypothetical protein
MATERKGFGERSSPFGRVGVGVCLGKSKIEPISDRSNRNRRVDVGVRGKRHKTLRNFVPQGMMLDLAGTKYLNRCLKIRAPRIPTGTDHVSRQTRH